MDFEIISCHLLYDYNEKLFTASFLSDGAKQSRILTQLKSSANLVTEKRREKGAVSMEKLIDLRQI
jgi:hypothetical protein